MSKAAIFAIFIASVIATGALAQGVQPAADPTPPGWTTFAAQIADAKKSMMADPKATVEKARKANAFAQAQPVSAYRSEAIATSLWLEGEALTRINQVKEAQVALDAALKLANADKKTTRLDGDLALSEGRLADANGNIALALKNYQRAHDIFARLDIPRYQSIALQCLGNIYEKAHDYNREIAYYRRASQVYSDDPALELSADNNIGFALQGLGRYDQAIDRFNNALKIAKTLDSPFLEADILTNLAATYARSNRFSDAEKTANKALKLLAHQKDTGQEPFAWGAKAEVEYERGDVLGAVADMNRAFKGLDLTKTISPFRDMHKFAYQIYARAGDYALALQHLEAFKRLDDEGRSLTASANLALLGAQFDFANQRLEIEHLKSEQLKRDMSLRESRAATQRALFAAALILGLLVILWISWRHMIVHRHRDELTKTLGERDVEIERRIKVEAQLRLAMEAAETANRAKSHFLANMSHELRTPLNAIIGFSNLMTLGTMSPAKNKEYAEDINASGRRLLVILDDILDMARIDAGAVKLEDEEASIREIMDLAIATLEEEIPGHGKSIHVQNGGDEIRLRCDRTRLRQVVGHLLSNAVKFTKLDGSVEIGFEIVRDGVDIVVTDNGMGIPPEKLTFVLEPFGQAESTYARTHGGIGLGLPIVKSLVELHGGLFTLSSKLGVGTSARVHLPATRILHPKTNSLPLAS
ncbi:MAG: ATP-binding protein [Rhizomicrobium sp.]